MHNLRTVRKLWIQFSLTRKQTQLQVFIAKHAFWDLTLGYYVGVVMWCHKYKIILPFCAFFYHLICGAVENFFAMSYQCLPYFHFILTTPMGHIDAPIIWHPDSSILEEDRVTWCTEIRCNAQIGLKNKKIWKKNARVKK